jgi:hypothetical protein
MLETAVRMHQQIEKRIISGEPLSELFSLSKFSDPTEALSILKLKAIYKILNSSGYSETSVHEKKTIQNETVEEVRGKEGIRSINPELKENFINRTIQAMRPYSEKKNILSRRLLPSRRSSRYNK